MADAAPPADYGIQHIIVRGDLKKLGWNAGSIIAQACHASVLAILKFSADPQTVTYTQHAEAMSKVVVEAKDEVHLRALSDELTLAGVDHVLWQELPENFPTAIATKPVPRASVAPALKALRLMRSL